MNRRPRPNTRPRHKPRYEGETINNLYCPCGWCKDKHSKAIAKYITINDKRFLVWLFKSPCLTKIERIALGRCNRII